MTQHSEDFFLFVGTVTSEAATTEIRTNGLTWIQKMLSSKPDNWNSIIELIKSPHNRGTIVQLTARDYGRIVGDAHSEVASMLFRTLASKTHIVFVHEAVLLTEDQRGSKEESNPEPILDDEYADTEQDPLFARFFVDEPFPEVPPNVRSSVNALLRDCELDVRPYRSNFERSTMARKFVEDGQSNLLFRIYVPSGRLYAEETEALLGIFRDWLSRAGRGSVRQDGYKTNAGRVIEFHMEQPPKKGLAAEWAEFADFLVICEESPDQAAVLLMERGAPEEAAKRLVEKWHREFGRLRIAMNREHRKAAANAISDLEEIMLETRGMKGQELEEAVEILLPKPSISSLVIGPDSTTPGSSVVNNVSIQNISTGTANIVQGLHGTANFGPEARELFALIEAYGGDRRHEFESAVHELEDEGTRGEERTAAKSRLMGFLASLGEKGADVGFGLLSKYLESKTGF